MLVDELRPSLSAFDALDAAGAEVFLVLVGSFWERADPAADLLFEPVLPLLSVFDAAVAALDDVVFPDMVSSISQPTHTEQARCAFVPSSTGKFLLTASVGDNVLYQRHEEGVMSGRVPTDESAQVGHVHALVTALSQDAILDGYDHHAVAEALLHAARDVLADDTEFWTVFTRFKALRWP